MWFFEDYRRSIWVLSLPDPDVVFRRFLCSWLKHHSGLCHPIIQIQLSSTWIYFIFMWMKRRIQKVKKFELLISTSTTTYKLQLHNWYHFQNMVVGWFLPSNIFQWYAAELYRCFISRSIRRSYKLSDLVLFHSISLHIYEFYIWGNITLFLSAQLLHSE